MGVVSRRAMKSTVAYHGEAFETSGWLRTFNAKFLAMMSGIYTLVSRWM
jgi:hypothetical protein